MVIIRHKPRVQFIVKVWWTNIKALPGWTVEYDAPIFLNVWIHFDKGVGPKKCIARHSSSVNFWIWWNSFSWIKDLGFFGKEKVNFRSQILECPSIGQYWNILGVPVLPENVILTFFRTCLYYSEAYNTGTQKWYSIVQYSCTSIWDLKYTFSFGNNEVVISLLT